MDLDQLERVGQLKADRAHAIALRAGIGRARLDMAGVIVSRTGSTLDTAYFLPKCVGEQQLRAAIFELCTNQIIVIEAELAKAGVRVSPREPLADGTAAQWKREAGMYQQAWQRELGSWKRYKRHLIDSLVCSTRDLCEAWAKCSSQVSSVRRWAEDAGLCDVDRASLQKIIGKEKSK